MSATPFAANRKQKLQLQKDEAKRNALVLLTQILAQKKDPSSPSPYVIEELDNSSIASIKGNPGIVYIGKAVEYGEVGYPCKIFDKEGKNLPVLFYVSKGLYGDIQKIIKAENEAVSAIAEPFKERLSKATDPEDITSCILAFSMNIHQIKNIAVQKELLEIKESLLKKAKILRAKLDAERFLKELETLEKEINAIVHREKQDKTSFNELKAVANINNKIKEIEEVEKTIAETKNELVLKNLRKAKDRAERLLVDAWNKFEGEEEYTLEEQKEYPLHYLLLQAENIGAISGYVNSLTEERKIQIAQQRNARGYTPLDVAIMQGNLEIVKGLFKLFPVERFPDLLGMSEERALEKLRNMNPDMDFNPAASSPEIERIKHQAAERKALSQRNKEAREQLVSKFRNEFEAIKAAHRLKQDKVDEGFIAGAVEKAKKLLFIDIDAANKEKNAALDAFLGKISQEILTTDNPTTAKSLLKMKVEVEVWRNTSSFQMELKALQQKVILALSADSDIDSSLLRSMEAYLDCIEKEMEQLHQQLQPQLDRADLLAMWRAQVIGKVMTEFTLIQEQAKRLKENAEKYKQIKAELSALQGELATAQALKALNEEVQRKEEALRVIKSESRVHWSKKSEIESRGTDLIRRLGANEAAQKANQQKIFKNKTRFDTLHQEESAHASKVAKFSEEKAAIEAKKQEIEAQRQKRQQLEAELSEIRAEPLQAKRIQLIKKRGTGKIKAESVLQQLTVELSEIDAALNHLSAQATIHKMNSEGLAKKAEMVGAELVEKKKSQSVWREISLRKESQRSNITALDGDLKVRSEAFQKAELIRQIQFSIREIDFFIEKNPIFSGSIFKIIAAGGPSLLFRYIRGREQDENVTAILVRFRNQLVALRDGENANINDFAQILDLLKAAITTQLSQNISAAPKEKLLLTEASGLQQMRDRIFGCQEKYKQNISLEDDLEDEKAFLGELISKARTVDKEIERLESISLTISKEQELLQEKERLEQKYGDMAARESALTEEQIDLQKRRKDAEKEKEQLEETAGILTGKIDEINEGKKQSELEVARFNEESDRLWEEIDNLDAEVKNLNAQLREGNEKYSQTKLDKKPNVDVKSLQEDIVQCEQQILEKQGILNGVKEVLQVPVAKKEPIVTRSLYSTKSASSAVSQTPNFPRKTFGHEERRLRAASMMEIVPSNRSLDHKESFSSGFPFSTPGMEEQLASDLDGDALSLPLAVDSDIEDMLPPSLEIQRCNSADDTPATDTPNLPTSKELIEGRKETGLNSRVSFHSSTPDISSKVRMSRPKIGEQRCRQQSEDSVWRPSSTSPTLLTGNSDSRKAAAQKRYSSTNVQDVISTSSPWLAGGLG